MVESCRCPRTGAVTVGAIGSCRDMRRVLAGSGCAVVAARARARDAGVIEGGWGPRTGAVAIGAVRCRRDMGRIFAGGVGAVVAACT